MNFRITSLGLLYLLLPVLLVYTLAGFWPSVQVTANQADGTPYTDWDPNVTWFGQSFELPTETRLFWLVVIAAALGSYVHSVTSFASYVGNQTFANSWLWWYLLRPPIGVSLALLFYFVIRGGLLAPSALGSDISPFGVAALSGLVGMFSKQATDKLREVFDNLFQADGGDRDRRNKLEACRPVITDLDPTNVPAAGEEFELTVRGERFTSGSMVLVNDEKRTTVFRSDRELIVRLKSQDTVQPGKVNIVVKAPPPSTEQSDAFELDVFERADSKDN